MERFFLVGFPLKHSFSKKIHDLFGYDYQLMPLDEIQFESFIRQKAFNGINVTIPYKQKVLQYIDDIHPLAKEIGAVNTVVNVDGKLVGYNTDFFGLKYALNYAKIKLNDKKVLILGSGGASLTAMAVAKELKAKRITIISRNGKDNYQSINKYFDSQVIINATSVGMYPNNDGQLVNLKDFKSLEGVFDVVYNPLKTNLILQAEELKIKNSGGLAMLVAQAKKARDIFLGNEIDDELIAQILEIIEEQMKNIVFIGMPGCGKTSVGKNVSKKTKRVFFDSDKLIEIEQGLSVEEIFQTKGEQFFREKEKEILIKLSRQNGVVIATGGGAIKDMETTKALRQNGFIVYLNRSLEKLRTEGRPLSKSFTEIEKLFLERSKLYEMACDIKIENSNSKRKTVSIVLEKFYESFSY